MSQYVCQDHRTVRLQDVRAIRADIERPAGAEVVGSCATCQAGRKSRILSYGVPATLAPRANRKSARNEELWRLHAQGVDGNALAAKFGITKQRVSQLLRGK